ARSVDLPAAHGLGDPLELRSLAALDRAGDQPGAVAAPLARQGHRAGVPGPGVDLRGTGAQAALRQPRRDRAGPPVGLVLAGAARHAAYPRRGGDPHRPLADLRPWRAALGPAGVTRHDILR